MTHGEESREDERAQKIQGAVAGRYYRRRLIGEGSGGEVWLAEDSFLHRPVALKLLPPSSHSEALVAASLEHPSIVKVFDVGSVPTFDFIAMQFIEGRALSEVRLDLAQALDVTRQIAEALEYAHSQGIIHRDVKPSNILLDPRGKAFLTDFGLAKCVSTGSATGSIIGTPAYMSPEQARGERVDARADVYGLGATLYSLIAGHAPFRADSLAEVLQEVQKRDPRRLAAPRDVQVIVAHAMEKDIQRRYASMTEFRDDLQRYLNGEPIRARPSSITYLARKWVMKRAWVASALLVAAIALGSLFAISRGSHQRATPLEEVPRERHEQQLPQAKRSYDEGLERFALLESFLSQWEQKPEDVQEAVRTTIESFTRALAIDPSYGEAALQIARVSLEAVSNEEAKRWANRAIEVSPKLATAYLFRALLTLQQYEPYRHFNEGDLGQDTEEARKAEAAIASDLEQVERWQRDVGELDFARGLEHFAQGAYADTAECLVRYLKRAAGDWQAQYWCAHAYLHAGNFDETIRHADRAIQLRPRCAWAYTMRGIAHHHKEEHAQAIEDYTRAIEVDPRNAAAYTNRGLVRRITRDLDGALKDYTVSIALDPKLAQTYYNRGLVYRELKNLDAALQDFMKAIETSPRYVDAYLERGIVRRLRGTYLRALDDLNKFIEFAPKDLRGYLNRGLVYLEMKKSAAAIEDYTKVIGLDPKNATAYTDRGLAREQMKDYSAALDDQNKAIELNPNFAEAYSNRGLVKMQIADLPGAISDFTRAIELNSNTGRAYAGRGLAYEELSRSDRPHEREHLEAAAADLSRALEIMGPGWNYGPTATATLQEVRRRLEKLRRDY